MLKNISSLGTELNKAQLKSIIGGGSGTAICNLPEGQSGTSSCTFPASTFEEAETNASTCCGSNGVKTVFFVGGGIK